MEQHENSEIAENFWRTMLNTGLHQKSHRQRKLFKLLPHNPRCTLCYSPFGGIGGFVLRLVMDKRPSKLNPRFCNACELFAREHPGGAEVDLAFLFADIRGSTPLAEQIGTARFTHLIDRFFQASAEVLIETNAIIEKMVGDQVTGLYFPGIAGSDYVRVAIQAGEKLLERTGHKNLGGPWAPVGVGVHAGRAFVGSIGTTDFAEITVLGDDANVAARLASIAGTGEMVISSEAVEAAHLPTDGLEMRQVELKGKSGPRPTWIKSVMESKPLPA